MKVAAIRFPPNIEILVMRGMLCTSLVQPPEELCLVVEIWGVHCGKLSKSKWSHKQRATFQIMTRLGRVVMITSMSHRVQNSVGLLFI